MKHALRRGIELRDLASHTPALGSPPPRVFPDTVREGRRQEADCGRSPAYIRM
jgi:hypothetical protein